MTLHDLVDLSIGSLWRIKLRAFLTIAGVVIAIATFVAMLSFAAGNQKWVARAYNELGLLSDPADHPERVFVLAARGGRCRQLPPCHTRSRAAGRGWGRQELHANLFKAPPLWQPLAFYLQC